MKKVLFLACVALALASCEKDPGMGQLTGDLVVYTDYDKEADFGGYATYFLPDSILEAGGVHAVYWKDENAKRLVREVEDQMSARGYTRITDPERKDEADAGLQLSYVSQTNQVVAGGYWNGWWDWGFWGPGWGGWYYPYPVTYTYDTNALVLEMVDLKGAAGADESRLPVVWYASAYGFQYGSGRVNMQLLMDGIDQAFRQSAYVTRNK